MRFRISATPPPTAVELMLRMRLPSSFSARSLSSSITCLPTIGSYSLSAGFDCDMVRALLHFFLDQMEDALAQAFHRLGVRVEFFDLARELPLSEGRLEPVGKIVDPERLPEPSGEDMVIKRADADL